MPKFFVGSKKEKGGDLKQRLFDQSARGGGKKNRKKQKDYQKLKEIRHLLGEEVVKKVKGKIEPAP